MGNQCEIIWLRGIFMVKRIIERGFEKMIISIKLVKDDFLRFLLLAIIIIISGSVGVAHAFGCLYGSFVLALIVLFALGALLIHNSSTRNTELASS
jgi:Kef-type K+ transport system membrane component KefB